MAGGGGEGGLTPIPPKNDPFIMKLDKNSMMTKLIGTIYWKNIIISKQVKLLKMLYNGGWGRRSNLT